jgi:hypothetical protein
MGGTTGRLTAALADRYLPDVGTEAVRPYLGRAAGPGLRD